MENSVYNNLGQRKNFNPNRALLDKKVTEFLTLKDIIENRSVVANKKEFKLIFVNSIKSLLQKESLFELIHSFFELEQQLHDATDLLEFEIDHFNFDDFYKNLSPLILRSLYDNSEKKSDPQVILNSIKESIRVALEEDLYHLEDKK